MRSKSKSQKALKGATNKAKPLTDKSRFAENKRENLLFDNLLAMKLDDIGSAKKNEACVEAPLFENLAELVKPELVASILGISVKTIYDWRYRFKQRKVPEDLFVKINRSLLVRTKVLRHWIASQNPALLGEGE